MAFAPPPPFALDADADALLNELEQIFDAESTPKKSLLSAFSEVRAPSLSRMRACATDAAASLFRHRT